MIASRALTVKAAVLPLAEVEFVQEPVVVLRYCHWYWRSAPFAAMVKVAVVPSSAVTFFGCVVITGLASIVRVATLLYTEPELLETLQRYW